MKAMQTNVMMVEGMMVGQILSFCIVFPHSMDDFSCLIVREIESSSRSVDEKAYNKKLGLVAECAITQRQILFVKVAVYRFQSA